MSETRGLALLVAASLGVAACHQQSEESRKAEAAVVARAVEALRQAPNDGKRPLLKALEATPCEAADVCSLKKACTAAYTLEQTALDGLRAVRAQSKTGAGLGAEAVELLTSVEKDLARSRDLAKACADLEAKARRQYSL